MVAVKTRQDSTSMTSEDKFLREIEVKGKMEERTGWRGRSESQRGGEETKSGRLVAAAETSKELAE